FKSALNAPLGEISKQDVTAWRYMTALAGGTCQNASGPLESALKTTSSNFPKDQANALLLDCRLKDASSIDQLLAINHDFGDLISAAQSRDLRARLADAYATQGIAAEDRKDLPAAVAAYKNAIQWNPAHSKARFNLGAIYI